MKIKKYIQGGAIVVFTFVSIFTILPTTVSAAGVPTCTLNASEQSYSSGGTTLSWNVQNATNIYLTGIGSVAAHNTMIVYPQTTTNYTLTASNAAGVSSCTTTAFPSPMYNSGILYGANTTNQTCRMWVNPDLVVPGGTGILSWSAGSALRANIDHGIGSVSNRGTHVISNIGIPQTFTMTARWGNGATRTCSATLIPATGSTTNISTPPVYHTTNTYVSINQVPYTGTNDIWYVLVLLGIALSSFTLVYIRRKTLIAILLD